MIKYHYSLCFFLLFFVHYFIFINPSCASKNKVTKLVDEVCAKTSNYSFCVESLYSDPHTPQSDRYGLAFVVFGLAYQNATNTEEYIAKLMKKTTTSRSNYHMLLQRCAHDYKEAVSAIETAYNDLNSETFFELADLAGDASHAAEDCQATLRGTSHYSLLDSKNNALKGLCEICVVVSKLFTGS